MDLRALGERVQSARHERGLTLQALARRASVSVSMLSSVEHGQKAPTIVVLDRIARGLRVPLTELLAPPRESRVIIRRKAEHDTIDEPGGWRRQVLTPVVPGVNFEWIRTTLPPHTDAGEFPAYAANSHEYVLVDSGSLRLTIADESFDLRSGDLAYFAADVPHGYANTTAKPCSYLVAALIMRARGPGTSRGRV